MRSIVLVAGAAITVVVAAVAIVGPLGPLTPSASAADVRGVVELKKSGDYTCNAMKVNNVAVTCSVTEIGGAEYEIGALKVVHVSKKTSAAGVVTWKCTGDFGTAEPCELDWHAVNAINDPGPWAVPVLMPVGGTTELLVSGSDAPSEDASSSGDSTLPIAAAAGGLLIALAGGGLYMRRRLVH